jgi:hypothetical protein
MQQFDLQPVFETLDLHTHSRLRPVERRRGAREGLMIRHGDKGFQEIGV